MNAYELAKIVDKWAYRMSAEYLTDAANMLRQQADRIAELEKQTKPLSDEEIQALWTVKHPNVMSLNPDLLEFARAIEERHGIK